MNSSTPRPSVLRETPFALFWGARVASAIAFQMQAVAVGWQAYALTGSAFYLGLVGLAQFLPMFLLTLAVGHVADRCLVSVPIISKPSLVTLPFFQ